MTVVDAEVVLARVLEDGKALTARAGWRSAGAPRSAAPAAAKASAARCRLAGSASVTGMVSVRRAPGRNRRGLR